MFRYLSATGVIVVAALLFQPTLLEAQGNPGRVFLPTPSTVAIYEFNGLSDVPDGGPIPTGEIIPDLSGNGLDATTEGNNSGDLKLNTGDPNFNVPPGSNRECQRQVFNTHQARLAVNNDNDAFEMTMDDSFSIELYVNRETVTGSANWGILAGTWHSRNVLDDSQAPDDNGAWYGYGLIRNDVGGNPGAGGEWSWVLSPVVDGVPRIGFAQDPEQHAGFFDIPEGRHYVVLSVDRTAQTATVYVDSNMAANRTIDPTWSFTTPEGYEHARFLMFAGEDDPTRGAYRGAPAGTHLDAVRVQRAALTADDVTGIWNNIQSGLSSPVSDTAVRPVLTASKTSVIVGQCVRLSAENSSPGAGQTITKYEWKVDTGAFEEGSVTREVSFPAVNEAGATVSLRVTNSAAASAVTSTRIRVHNPPITSRVSVSLGTIPLPGASLVIPVGSVLTLDGTQSSTDVPADAFTCPLANNVTVPPSPITEYRWDLDGRVLSIEDNRPTFDTAPFNTVGDSKIALQVKNEAGQTSGFTFVKIKVADSKGNTLVFHNTPDTIVHYEFGDLSNLNLGDPLPTGQMVKDLSPNGRDGLVEENDAGDLTVGDGNLVYASQTETNIEVRRPAFSGNNARIAVNDDGDDTFEMTPDRDFSIELYVNRESIIGSANWGILAGTWHSRNVLDDAAVPETNGAWYGYGLIRNDRDANPPSEWSWVLSPVVNGVPRIGFAQDPEQHLQPFFDIPEGLHYLVLTVDRTAQRAAGYVDGVEVTRTENLPAEWAFTTPDGYEHARFLLFAGEDDPTRAAFRGSPAGTGIDAVRVQGIALTKEQVATNWQDISSGAGADPQAVPPGTKFHRGDADSNGSLQLTDAVRILNFLFLGTGHIDCMDAADADNNGTVQLTDAVRILNVLFLGTGTIPDPGPPGETFGNKPCGPDPDDKHIGCAAYDKC